MPTHVVLVDDKVPVGQLPSMELNSDQFENIGTLEEPNYSIKEELLGQSEITLASTPPSDTNIYFNTATNKLGINSSNVWYYFTSSDNTAGIIEEALDFTTNTGMVNTSGVWLGTVGPATNYLNFGLASKYLASGQDGYIKWRYTAIDGENALMNFSLTNTNKRYSVHPGDTPMQYHASAYVFSGLIYRIDDLGAVTSTGVTADIGDYLRIIRSGSVIKLQKSPDSTTWTDVYTYAFSSVADLYVNGNVDLDFKIYNPIGYNLTA